MFLKERDSVITEDIGSICIDTKRNHNEIPGGLDHNPNTVNVVSHKPGQSHLK